MVTYAILANPGHNRVYFDASKELSLAELTIAANAFSTSCKNFRCEDIAEVPYYMLDAEETLTRREMGILSRLSFCYAIFTVEACGEAQKVLLPVSKVDAAFFNPSISTILKYSGKTNELFTRTMLNAALYSSSFAGENGQFRLLDPISGKGTTLYEGLICGFDVSGVEIGEKTVHEASVYFKKFLESEKWKHSHSIEKLSGENKSYQAKFHRFEFASTKEEWKNPDKLRHLTMVAGDSRFTDRYFKKNSFHMIVGDLPYGVAHGNVAGDWKSADGKTSGSLTRNPKELICACLPAWWKVLKQGGVLALSWNAFVLPKKEMAGAVEKNGFTVLVGGPYDKFEHRVDQAIKRDILIARK